MKDPSFFKLWTDEKNKSELRIPSCPFVSMAGHPYIKMGAKPNANEVNVVQL